MSFILVMMFFIDVDTLADETNDVNHYCDMVKLNKINKDKPTMSSIIGWPDYKNIYNTQCK